MSQDFGGCCFESFGKSWWVTFMRFCPRPLSVLWRINAGRNFVEWGKLLLADAHFNLFSSQTSVISKLHPTSKFYMRIFCWSWFCFYVYFCSQTSCHLYLKSVVFNWKSVQSVCQGKRLERFMRRPVPLSFDCSYFFLDASRLQCYVCMLYQFNMRCNIADFSIILI